MVLVCCVHWFREDVLGLNYEVPWTYFGDDTIRPKLALHTSMWFSIGHGVEVASKGTRKTGWSKRNLFESNP